MFGSDKSFVVVYGVIAALGIVALQLFQDQLASPAPLDPAKFSAVAYEEDRYELFDRASESGQAIARAAYGPYSRFVLNDVARLSLPRNEEFTLPRLEVANRRYLLREAPTMRFELWNHRAPEVLLVGSSVMFMSFVRQQFYRRLPGTHLIDFTAGNNFPELTEMLLDEAVRRGLTLPAGSIVVYGLAAYEVEEGGGIGCVECAFGKVNEELSRWYGVQSRRAADDAGVGEAPTPLKRLVSFGPLRRYLEGKFINLVNFRVFGVRPSDYVPEAVGRDDAQLTAYVNSSEFLGRIKKTTIAHDDPYDLLRDAGVASLRRVVANLNSLGATVVVVNMPTSSRLRRGKVEVFDAVSSLLDAMQHDQSSQFVYVDLFDGREIGLSDRDFLIAETGYFDDTHLNFDGGTRLTDFFVDRIFGPCLKRANDNHEGRRCVRNSLADSAP